MKSGGAGHGRTLDVTRKEAEAGFLGGPAAPGPGGRARPRRAEGAPRHALRLAMLPVSAAQVA
jgi:hypothetical protein